MLFAKISPIATFTENTSPFTPSISKTAEYLTAFAQPYAAGANQTNFQVVFGNIVKDDLDTPIEFITVSNFSLNLSKDQLITWGTNDEVLLNIIATQLGTTTTEFITFNASNIF